MIRSLIRKAFLRELDKVDAEIARWFVDDGTLSMFPLDAATPQIAYENGHRTHLRNRRLRAVRRLRDFGGVDPWPSVLREPTVAQRAAREARRQDERRYEALRIASENALAVIHSARRLDMTKPPVDRDELRIAEAALATALGKAPE